MPDKLLNKINRLHLPNLIIERVGDDAVSAEFKHQLGARVRRHQIITLLHITQHLVRMRKKRDDHRQPLAVMGLFSQPFDECLMSDMQAVKHANGHHRRHIELCILKIADVFHGESLYRH